MAEGNSIFLNQNMESVPVNSGDAQVSTVLNIGSLFKSEVASAASSENTIPQVSTTVQETLVDAQPNAGNVGQIVAPLRGQWTVEEDNSLKEMVKVYGERKWSVIAGDLPGRTGKQCRERWINNLRPDIRQNEIWTEEEDRLLIEAHKCYGNRWSAIARCLTGRSENAVKNHWNATKRSLSAKRRFKKKRSDQAPPGQFSLLERYIRSLYPPSEIVRTPTEPDLLGNLGHGEEACPKTIAAPAVSDPLVMGMYTNLAGMQEIQPCLSAYGEPPVLYYLPSFTNNTNHALQTDMNSEGPQGTYNNVNYPLATNVVWQSSNQGRFYSEAGPSYAAGSAATDDIDVVQVASREFFMPSEDDATLDLTKFI